jgi:hypothetical protein
MTTTSLDRPEPRQLMPTAVVEALIDAIDREIAALERAAADAVAAADEVEAQLAAAGVDERSSAWAMVQLERFVARLERDVEAHAAEVVEEAELRARRRLDVAAPAVAVTLAAAAVPDLVEVAEAAPTPEPAPSPAPSPEPEPASEMIADIDLVALAPDQDFWPAEAKRRRLPSRASRRVLVTQGAAALLLVAAVVVRFV